MESTRKIAVVTGASRGIGAAIVRALRADEMTVVGISRETSAADANLWLKCDVSRNADVQSAVDCIHERFGRIDVLVNSAGVSTYAELHSTTDDAWESTIAVNLTGAFYTMRATLPAMTARGWGRIINIASIAGQRGEPQMAAYAASKHGIIGLTRSAALQAARSGVTVNAICPGAVSTDMLGSFLRGWADESGRSVELGRRVVQSANPQNRILEADEVAQFASYLASEAAKGVNGQSLSICGGVVTS